MTAAILTVLYIIVAVAFFAQTIILLDRDGGKYAHLKRWATVRAVFPLVMAALWPGVLAFGAVSRYVEWVKKDGSETL